MWIVDWAEDGRLDGRLAAGAGDGTIRVWSPGTDQGPVDVEAHDDGVWLVAWSSGGDLASSSEDNSVRITSLPVTDPATLLARFEGRGYRELTPEERRYHHLPLT